MDCSCPDVHLKFPNDIACFQHCKGIKVYCSSIPEKCPSCEQCLNMSEFSVPPFRIHFPLACKPHALTLLVKPSTGCFTSGFILGKSSLHIGITNSSGSIYEYDYNGARINTEPSKWNHHVSIRLELLGISLNLLDSVLKNKINHISWIAERYNEIEHNCFDFIVDILNSCNTNQSNGLITKFRLAEEAIMPVLKRIVKILSLFRKVTDEGGVFVFQSISATFQN